MASEETRKTEEETTRRGINIAPSNLLKIIRPTTRRNERHNPRHPNLARAVGQAAEESEGLGTLPPLGDSSQRSSGMANCTHRSSEIANRALEKRGIKMKKKDERKEEAHFQINHSFERTSHKNHMCTIFQNGIRRNEENRRRNDKKRGLTWQPAPSRPGAPGTVPGNRLGNLPHLGRGRPAQSLATDLATCPISAGGARRSPWQPTWQPAPSRPGAPGAVPGNPLGNLPHLGRGRPAQSSATHLATRPISAGGTRHSHRQPTWQLAPSRPGAPGTVIGNQLGNLPHLGRGHPAQSSHTILARPGGQAGQGQRALVKGTHPRRGMSWDQSTRAALACLLGRFDLNSRSQTQPMPSPSVMKSRATTAFDNPERSTGNLARDNAPPLI